MPDEQANADAVTKGLIRCTRYGNHWPPDDIHKFGARDYRDFAIESVSCFVARNK